MKNESHLVVPLEFGKIINTRILPHLVTYGKILDRQSWDLLRLTKPNDKRLVNLDSLENIILFVKLALIL